MTQTQHQNGRARSTAAVLPHTAALYVRVSTRGQEDDGTSLESQEERGRAYCAEHGLTVDQVYTDVHSGADYYERNGLQQLLADMKASHFDVVVAYAIDRLSREQRHLGAFLTSAQQHGVAVEFVTEKLDESPQGKLLLSVAAFAAELEREKIRERSLRGRRQHVLQGKVHNAGAELYGWRKDRERGVRVLYEPEAAVVRRIYTWIGVHHYSTARVCRLLTVEGVPPPKPPRSAYVDSIARWHSGTLARLISNPAYKGHEVVWRTRSITSASDRSDPHYDTATTTLMRPPEDWIELPEGVTPAIVSPAKWQAANDSLTERRSRMRTHNETRPRLLRGMVYCGVCGRKMHGADGTNGAGAGNRPYHYYRCSSQNVQKGGHTSCGGANLPALELEAWAWERVATVLRDPEAVKREIARLEAAGPDTSAQADLENAKRELNVCRNAQTALMRQYTDSLKAGNAMPWHMVERESARLEAEALGWEKNVADATTRLAQQAGKLHRLEAIEVYCSRWNRNIDTFDWRAKRDALEGLEARVTGNGRNPEQWEIQLLVDLSSVEDASLTPMYGATCTAAR